MLLRLSWPLLRVLLRARRVVVLPGARMAATEAAMKMTVMMMLVLLGEVGRGMEVLGVLMVVKTGMEVEVELLEMQVKALAAMAVKMDVLTEVCTVTLPPFAAGELLQT